MTANAACTKRRIIACCGRRKTQIQACIAHSVAVSRKQITGSAAVSQMAEEGMDNVFKASATAVRVRCGSAVCALLLLGILIR